MGKKLRDIEHRKYDAAQFINELKAQITEIVNDVLRDNSNRRVAVTTEEELKKKTARKAAANKRKTNKPTKQKSEAPNGTPSSQMAEDSIMGTTCPLCGQGTIIKGRSAYGCSNWRNGCSYRKPFGTDA